MTFRAPVRDIAFSLRHAAGFDRLSAAFPEVDADTVEVISPAGWITATQLAHLERDRTGKIVALSVSTGRIKKMRFERVA